ncbi:hypothetical protein [Amycolatopsis sp. NPDC051371]|uniref:hypothetical protein n=1 Tax=Amycolatopsis sp. NPDC051371 TaxID=3155800 RepID=UPI003431A0CA
MAGRREQRRGRQLGQCDVDAGHPAERALAGDLVHRHEHGLDHELRSRLVQVGAGGDAEPDPLADVVPLRLDQRFGLVVIALSYQLPQLLVPVLATPLLAIGDAGPNYFALFLGSVAAAVFGALAVLPIKDVR